MIIKEKMRNKITESKNVYSIMDAILKTESEIDQEKEHFWVIGLDGAHNVKYIELSTLGIVNQCQVHPREVFRLAILKGVVSIIVCHNHPSGTIKPSDADNRVTKMLKDSGDILGIKVLDHVIIGDGYYSYAENGEI